MEMEMHALNTKWPRPITGPDLYIGIMSLVSSTTQSLQLRSIQKGIPDYATSSTLVTIHAWSQFIRLSL